MATEWEVTGQRQVDELTDQGSFQPTMEVYFRTIPEGVAGTVKIPLRVYTPDYVRAQIDGYVTNIKSIQNL